MLYAVAIQSRRQALKLFLAGILPRFLSFQHRHVSEDLAEIEPTANTAGFSGIELTDVFLTFTLTLAAVRLLACDQ